MGDRRTRKSKEALRKAFIELLKRKPLHEIQIKQLCDAADLNRSTFYNNYNDIDDILKDIYCDTVNAIFSESTMLKLENAKSKDEIYDIIHQKIIFFQTNSDLFTLILSQPAKISFEEILYTNFLNTLNLWQTETKERYRILYQIIGNFCLIRTWMIEGYPISAEEFSLFLTELMLDESKKQS